MAYSNSPLVSYTKLSPNHSGLRNHSIDTISIHCMAGNLTVEVCGSVFAPTSRGASSNYGIGSDGRIALYVEEKNRSWCTSSASNDHRAVTIEVANCTGGPDWKISNAALLALIDLCEDICKRNDIKELKWCADKSLIGQVDKQNMTCHRWFVNKSCPGNYLYKIHSYIAEEVNKRLKTPKGVEETMTEQELNKMVDEKIIEKLEEYKKYFEKMANEPDFSTWSAAEVNRAVEMGITDGTRPHAFATREESAVMAVRTADYIVDYIDKHNA